MPFREMLIVFLVVLCAGAFYNGMPKEEDPVRDAMSDVQQNSGQQKALLDNPLIATGTEDNFKEEVLSSSKPVLVEFYADSDPDCAKMAPIVADIANTFQGSLKVVKVDVMNNANLYKQYEIGELPGLIVFKNGKKSQALAGPMTQSDVADFLKRDGVQASPAPPSGGNNAG